MKKRLLLISIFALSFLTACNLNSADESLKEDLVGTWVEINLLGDVQGNIGKISHIFEDDYTYQTVVTWKQEESLTLVYNYLLDGKYKVDEDKLTIFDATLYKLEEDEGFADSQQSLRELGPSAENITLEYSLNFEQEINRLTLEIDCPYNALCVNPVMEKEVLFELFNE